MQTLAPWFEPEDSAFRVQAALLFQSFLNVFFEVHAALLTQEREVLATGLAEIRTDNNLRRDIAELHAPVSELQFGKIAELQSVGSVIVAKRLRPENAYRKCLQFIETRAQEAGQNEMKDFLKRQVLLALDYKEKEIEGMQLESMDDSEFQKVVRDRITRAMTGNCTRQKVVGLNDVEKFISEGYDFVSQLPGGKAIVKLPF